MTLVPRAGVIPAHSSLSLRTTHLAGARPILAVGGPAVRITCVTDAEGGTVITLANSAPRSMPWLLVFVSPGEDAALETVGTLLRSVVTARGKKP